MSTAVEMAAVEAGGIIAEDVIPKLFKISPVERPLIDSIGSVDAHNTKKEFTDKVLQAHSATNALIENGDLSAVVDNNYGLRYYNWCQQPGKVIKMSQRGRDVRTTYNEDEFLEQLISAGDELRRDEEAAAVSRNAATPANPGVAGSLMAGMATWAIHNITGARGTTGTDAVLDGGTNVGGGPTTAPGAGNKRGLTETLVRDTLRYGWENGAKFDFLMSTGDMIEALANYFFTSSARVATAYSNVPQGNRRGTGDGNGAQEGGVTAQGAVNMFVGNFGAVTLVPNRQMDTYTAADTGDVVDVLFFDSRYPQMAYLGPYRTKTIAANGLYDQEVIYVDSCLIPGATHSIATVADITPTDVVTP